MTIKKTLMTLLATAGLASAITMYGFFINTPNCSLKVYRMKISPGGRDTLKTRTGSRGNWGIVTQNFIPEALQGETLYVEDMAKRVKTFMIRGPPEYNSLDLHLDKFTACATEMDDSSHLNEQLKCAYQLLRHTIKPETVDVDTHDVGLNFYYDLHLPLPKDSVHNGDSIYLKCYKVFGPANESIAFTERTFPLNRDRIDAQLLTENIPFPERRMLEVGEEPSQSVRKRGLEYKVYPSIVKDEVNVKGINGFIDLYDISGKKIAELPVSNGKLNLSQYSRGAYFLVPKKAELPSKKIVKIN